MNINRYKTYSRSDNWYNGSVFMVNFFEGISLPHLKAANRTAKIDHQRPWSILLHYRQHCKLQVTLIICKCQKIVQLKSIASPYFNVIHACKLQNQSRNQGQIRKKISYPHSRLTECVIKRNCVLSATMFSLRRELPVWRTSKPHLSLTHKQNPSLAFVSAILVGFEGKTI